MPALYDSSVTNKHRDDFIKLLFDESFAFALSPWNFVSERTVMGFGGAKQQQAYEIMGVGTLD